MSATATIAATGSVELDRAVVEFMATYEDLDSYRDAEGAWGQCEVVAEDFTAFLRERGFKAYTCTAEVAEFGYHDAQDTATLVAGAFTYPEHAMTEVYGLAGMGVNTVLIDFTAAQYGYTEFPKIEGMVLAAADEKMREAQEAFAESLDAA